MNFRYNGLVYVADDSDFFREICYPSFLGEFFSDYKFNIKKFENGEQLDQSLKKREDFGELSLVLLDNKMFPGPTGLEITEKYSGVYKGVPFVLISANSDLERYAIEKGAFDFLSKPFEKSEFENVLIRALDKDNEFLN